MANPETSRYMETHEWISASASDSDESVVGISDHAQKEITDVVFVELPEAGRKVAKGEAVAVVESVKAAFDIFAPVSGEITTVNGELSQNPAWVNESAHDKGWFYKIKVSDPKELEALMDFKQYQEFLKTA